MSRAILFLMVVALALSALTSVAFARGSVQTGGGEPPAEDDTPAVSAAAGTCADPIDTGWGGQFAGATAGYANSHDFYGCSGWEESGPEVIYSVNVSYSDTPNSITAELSNLPPGVDLDVFILSSDGCVAGSCAGSGSYGDATATAEGLSPGDYYIAVDGYHGAQGGYVLTVSEVAGTSLAFAPSNPSPAPGTTDVGARLLELSWDGGHQSGSAAGVTYYVYVREEGKPAGSQASCSPVTALGDVSRLSCSALMLKPGARYYWWVVAESASLGGYGRVPGPIWEFTTLPDTYLPLVLHGS